MTWYVEFSQPIGDWCAILSVSFGMNQKPMAGGADHFAQLHGAHFTKNMNTMSPELWKHSMKGTVFKIVWIELYKGDSPFLRYTLNDVMITSLQAAPGREERDQIEHVGLNFDSMSAQYFER